MKYGKWSTWAHYSHKLKTRILMQRSAGILEGEREGVRLVTVREGSFCKGCYVQLQLLVDENDGEIIDAKYQAYGETSLIGAMEVACEIVLRKNYDQACRISADLVDKQVQHSSKQGGFPPEAYSHINFALSVVELAAQKCRDIPLAEGYVLTPVEFDELEEGEYPDWEALDHDERINTIRYVIENDVQPYIELDDGGVTITELRGDRDVVIQYSGTCTSCYAATGSTLSAIQQILRKKVHPEITVTPDL